MVVRFIDHQGFAGGFTLGGVQAGMKLVGKIEGPGAFGARNCEVNRFLLGDSWELQEGKPDSWESLDAEVVLSNPPCSAFSSLSWGVNRKSYGMSSVINQCMHNMIGYAGQTMRTSPQVVVMESVQAAAVNGLPLMRELRDKLEAFTGHQYHLYHVLQNNGALGGCSIRRRYFMVLSRIPFGVEEPQPGYGPPATLRAAIGDLMPLDPHNMKPQRYVEMPSAWLMREHMTHPSGYVDGHATADHEAPGISRLIDLMPNWPQNRCLVYALRSYYAEHGRLPDSWHFRRQSGVWADEALIAKNMEMGFTRPKRWVFDLPSRVIIGGAMYLVVHPEQDRLLTHRECARIMGFPDTWKLAPLEGMRGLEETHGKGVSVSAGRWIARWAREAVEGRPGSVVGVPVTEHGRLAPHGPCERETVIDVSKVHHGVYPVKIVDGTVVRVEGLQDAA